MAAYVKEWQHVHAADTHAPKPPKARADATRLATWTRDRCSTCRRAIAVFPVGEGPEALKSLFRF